MLCYSMGSDDGGLWRLCFLWDVDRRLMTEVRGEDSCGW